MGRVGFEPTKAEPADFTNPKVSFWHGLYLYPIMGTLVSSLYGAPRTLRSSHGISTPISFHRYPREFILRLPLRAAIVYSLPQLATLVSAQFFIT